MEKPTEKKSQQVTIPSDSHIKLKVWAALHKKKVGESLVAAIDILASDSDEVLALIKASKEKEKLND